MTTEGDNASRVLDFFLHDAETIDTRADWFLIFNGILFEAFLAANHSVHRITLGVLGCFVNYIWTTVGIRHAWIVEHTRSLLSIPEIMGNETARVFSQLFEERRTRQRWWMRWARSTPAFAILLPLACFVAWLIVTTTAFDGRPRWELLILVFVVLALSTVLWVRLPYGPNVSSGKEAKE